MCNYETTGAVGKLIEEAWSQLPSSVTARLGVSHLRFAGGGGEGLVFLLVLPQGHDLVACA